MKSERTKEKIIENTIKLIREYDGDTEKITIRKIAEHAGVGTGLVNHYFGQKDTLIEICVQRIISNVIHSFHPENIQSNSPVERTKYTARQVMDFLMENRQISKVSILNDLNFPQAMDNTMRSAAGFERGLSGEKPNWEAKLEAFLITVIMQAAFLRKDVFKESMGIDFYCKKERDAFLGEIIEKICGGRSI